MIYLTETDYAKQMTEQVLPYLNARLLEGQFDGYDGKALHYIHYAADDPRGVVVVSHGFTESCRKFDECCYYFLQNGYTVYLLDHRGHGQSYRKLQDMTLTHIDRFEEYILDFERFINTVVRAQTSLPLYLYAHSMGGAVGTLYMERHPDTFAKAVLTSPMIAPSGGNIPLVIGKLLARLFMLCGRGAQRAFISGEYPGFEKYEDSYATSPVRFAYYEHKRRTTPYLQNYSPTYSWIYASIGVTGKILKKGAPEQVKTPVRLFAAAQDTVVLRAPQEALVKRLPHARLIEVNAKHEIYLSDDATIQPYFEQIFAFFAK